MSLEELRKQVQEEESKEAEQVGQVEATAEEVESEAEQVEETTEVVEELEDFDLEIEDGEPEPSQQKKVTAEKALLHKLTKEKKKRQEAKSELDTVKAELDQLKTMLAGQQQVQAPVQKVESDLPPVPVLYENGINTPQEYTQAYAKWMNDVNTIHAQRSQRQAQSQAAARQTQEKAENLAKRASDFIQEHNIKPQLVIDAIENATTEIAAHTGLDDALTVMLDAVGEGAERVAYRLGRNQNTMDKVKELISDDPSGMKAIVYMTRLAGQLKPKTKVSKAPEVDEPVKGDGSSSATKKLQSMYDKEKDPNKLLELRRKARELGVKLV